MTTKYLFYCTNNFCKHLELDMIQLMKIYPANSLLIHFYQEIQFFIKQSFEGISSYRKFILMFYTQAWRQ